MAEAYKFPHELEESEGKPVDDDDFEVEIEDDTPVQDRGRKPSPTPPDDPTEDELSSYDEKVQARIKKFTKGYHDERRAKEQAERERAAAEDFARTMYEQNQKLEAKLSAGNKRLIEKSKTSAAAQLTAAEEQYRKAFDAGDTEAVIAAQKALAKATMDVESAKRLRAVRPKTPTPVAQNAPRQQAQPQAPQLTPRTREWVAENSSWFGKDEEMTSAAMGLDRKLQREYGPDFIGTEEYFKVIDGTMQKRFPEQFGSVKPVVRKTKVLPSRAKKSATVVAPATRSTSPNRVKLMASEAAIARRLGVPIELYAKQKAAQMRNGE